MLPTPKLDNRDFESLLHEAREYFAQHAQGWTDQSVSDPGMVMLEVFAHLTEALIHQVNQIPDKVYVELLNLMGVFPRAILATELAPVMQTVAATLSPSDTKDETAEASQKVGAETVDKEAAEEDTRAEEATELAENDKDSDVDIEQYYELGQYITVAEQNFMVVALHKDMTGYKPHLAHVKQIEGELIGVATGFAGMILQVSQPMIAQGTWEKDNARFLPSVRLGVEISAEEKLELGLDNKDVLQLADKIYYQWQEVDFFGAEKYSFRVDRSKGMVYFPPADSYAVPSAGREIRLWYLTGGGVLRLPMTPPSSIEASAGSYGCMQIKLEPTTAELHDYHVVVTGKAPESLEQTKQRAPLTFFKQERAVTAEDYRYFLEQDNRVARALVRTAAQAWHHAEAGLIDIFVVPEIDSQQTPAHDIMLALKAKEQHIDLDNIAKSVRDKETIGARSQLAWVNYKDITIEAKVRLKSYSSMQTVKARLEKRLYERLSPVSVGEYSGWPFGQTLRLSDIYALLSADADVEWLDDAKLIFAKPENVKGVLHDPYQSNVWYCWNDTELWRSENNGLGWEQCVPKGESFQGIKFVRYFSNIPDSQGQKRNNQQGVVAVLCNDHALWLSSDCAFSFHKIVLEASELEKGGAKGGAIEDVYLQSSEQGIRIYMATNEALKEAQFTMLAWRNLHTITSNIWLNRGGGTSSKQGLRGHRIVAFENLILSIRDSKLNSQKKIIYPCADSSYNTSAIDKEELLLTKKARMVASNHHFCIFDAGHDKPSKDKPSDTLHIYSLKATKSEEGGDQSNAIKKVTKATPEGIDARASIHHVLFGENTLLAIVKEDKAWVIYQADMSIGETQNVQFKQLTQLNFVQDVEIEDVAYYRYAENQHFIFVTDKGLWLLSLSSEVSDSEVPTHWSVAEHKHVTLPSNMLFASQNHKIEAHLARGE